MSVRNDYSIDVMRLLDNLKQELRRPKSFMGITFGFNQDDMSMQVDKIRASLPRDLRDAASLAKESERLVETAKEESESLLAQARREAASIKDDAQKEADRIIEQGKIQQSQLVSESEVLKIAKAQADEIRNTVERDAREVKRGADKYAYDVLSSLEGVVGRVLATVEKGRSDLAPVSEKAAVAADGRERTKV